MKKKNKKNTKRVGVKKTIDTYVHKEAKRINIPTAELSQVAVLGENETLREKMVFEHSEFLSTDVQKRRITGNDPQLLWNGVSIRLNPEQIEVLKEGRTVNLEQSHIQWKGKSGRNGTKTVSDSPQLHVHEKVNPSTVVSQLLDEQSKKAAFDEDFLFEKSTILSSQRKTEFYEHHEGWKNRMILGDSLHVMTSICQREKMKNKVNCIYFDPPYGIEFGSNWQVSTKSKGVLDGATESVSKEPEQVQAFRDTWRNGIHSFLTYIRDRVTVMHRLLSYDGSMFFQIGEKNVHKVRLIMDEVFGEDCFIREILFTKKGSQKGKGLQSINDYILWYGKTPFAKGRTKYRELFVKRKVDNQIYKEFSKIELADGSIYNLKDYLVKQNSSAVEKKNIEEKIFTGSSLVNGGSRKNQMAPVTHRGVEYRAPTNNCWRHTSTPKEGELSGMERLSVTNRLIGTGSNLSFKRFFKDLPCKTISNWWDGLSGERGGMYVVQTNHKVIERCILMATDPGDVVLDPTCGSGTTAYVAEKWGRRWITIDTSRVALTLARTRLITSSYPAYFLQDSKEGQWKETEVGGCGSIKESYNRDIRLGFVCNRFAHITSTQIANNKEIDHIYRKWEYKIESYERKLLNEIGQGVKRWNVPKTANEDWSITAKKAHKLLISALEERKREFDASIDSKSQIKLFYDDPFIDSSKVRVSGPFTVESLYPHREMSNAYNSHSDRSKTSNYHRANFISVVISNLQITGISQLNSNKRIVFTELEIYNNDYIVAKGVCNVDDRFLKVGIFVGAEYSSVKHDEIMTAAAKAKKARLDLLIVCGLNFDARASDIKGVGNLKVLRARINPDLQMSTDLKTNVTDNLFAIYGEPDIDWFEESEGKIKVNIHGIDVFDFGTGETRKSGKDDIAVWFIDTNYNGEEFVVNHAYFLGGKDPFKMLKLALKTDIDMEVWSSLYQNTSREFSKPSTGCFAVKVINHFGDEVMKVYQVN